MILFYWMIEYGATFMEAVGCCFFTKIFIEKNADTDKNQKNRIMIYSALASVLVMLANKVDLFSFTNGMLGIFILWMLQFIIYRRKYSILALLTLIYAVIDSAIDLLVAQIWGIAFDMKPSYLLNMQSLNRCGCIFISKLILCILIYLVYKYNKSKLDIPKKYILIICFIAGTLMSFDYFIIEKSIAIENRIMEILSVVFFVASIILIILVFSLILKLAENYKQKQDISLLELQNEMIVKSEKNTEQVFNLWRSSIHDYKHKIFAIKHWLDEGNIKKVRDFIEKESESLSQKIFYIKTGSAMVDAIINTKRNIAEEKGIVFSINVAMPKMCIVSDLDLVCILGNLIDNAIEACEKQDKKHMEVVVKEIKKLLIIKVINSYQGQFTEKTVTTKKEKYLHGIGLKNVKSIVEKYDGTYEMSKEKDEVVTKIMILNTNEKQP